MITCDYFVVICRVCGSQPLLGKQLALEAGPGMFRKSWRFCAIQSDEVCYSSDCQSGELAILQSSTHVPHIKDC